jgi:hypothetical protein
MTAAVSEKPAEGVGASVLRDLGTEIAPPDERLLPSSLSISREGTMS